MVKIDKGGDTGKDILTFSMSKAPETLDNTHPIMQFSCVFYLTFPDWHFKFHTFSL